MEIFILQIDIFISQSTYLQKKMPEKETIYHIFLCIFVKSQFIYSFLALKGKQIIEFPLYLSNVVTEMIAKRRAHP